MRFRKIFAIIAVVAIGVIVVFCNKSDGTNKKLTPIIEKASANVLQAETWARKRGATATFVRLAPIYWQIAPASGVDPAIAYVQAAKETNYGKFTGVLNDTFHNPCGLKNCVGGSDYNPRAHMRFKDWKTGVQAHIDHLALYAGAKGYPKANTPDPRHFSSIFGKAAYVEELGGKWAPARNYGTCLVKQLLEIKKEK